MEVGEVPKGISWSAEAGGPPKVRIGGVSGRGRGPTSLAPRTLFRPANRVGLGFRRDNLVVSEPQLGA